MAEPAGSEDIFIGKILLTCLRNKEQLCSFPTLLPALCVSNLLSFFSSDGLLPDLHFRFNPERAGLCFPKLSGPTPECDRFSLHHTCLEVGPWDPHTLLLLEGKIEGPFPHVVLERIVD